MIYLGTAPGNRFLTKLPEDPKALLNELIEEKRNFFVNTGIPNLMVGEKLNIPIQNIDEQVPGSTLNSRALVEQLEAERRQTKSNWPIIIFAFLFIISILLLSCGGPDDLLGTNILTWLIFIVMTGVGVFFFFRSWSNIRKHGGYPDKVTGKCVGYDFKLKHRTTHNTANNRPYLVAAPVYEYYYHGQHLRAADDSYLRSTKGFPKVNSDVELWVCEEKPGRLYSPVGKKDDRFNMLLSAIFTVAMVLFFAVVKILN